ncbi:MAG: hypothetical protein NTZ16_06855 [Verrucomicrobia bacterium]|nr:hypothetical protein [Verrucomicrobiota bacterium]
MGAEGDGAGGVEAGGGDGFLGAEGQHGGFAGLGFGFRGEGLGQDLDKGFGVGPAVATGVAEEGDAAGLERGFIGEGGRLSAGEGEENFLDDLGVAAGDEEGVILAEVDFHGAVGGRGGRGIRRGGGGWLAGGKFFQRGGEVVAGDDEDGEFEVADFFGLERLVGVGPLALEFGEVGLEEGAVGFAVHEEQPAGQGIGRALPAVLDEGEGDLSLGERGVVGETDAEVVLQRADEFGLELVHEFVGEGFHGGVAPELHLGGLLALGAGLGEVGHGEQHEGVGGEEFLGRGNFGAGGAGGNNDEGDEGNDFFHNRMKEAAAVTAENYFASTSFVRLGGSR